MRPLRIAGGAVLGPEGAFMIGDLWIADRAIAAAGGAGAVAFDARGLKVLPGIIDITPGVNADKARHITDFVNGPTSFDDFDA